jgi:hypothetical protein
MMSSSYHAPSAGVKASLVVSWNYSEWHVWNLDNLRGWCENCIMTTTRIETIEKIIEEHGERIDPGDMYTVLSIVADALSFTSTREFIEESRLALDLIECTQSNFTRGRNRLLRIARLDDALARYGDGDPIGIPSL